MSKKVLTVGNCSFDQGNLSHMLQKQFGAEVGRATGASQALEALRAGQFDLVLVNRVFARDGGSGLDLIRQLKADPHLAATPVMLLSDYPEAQATAVAEGAQTGFGKSQLDSPAVRERLTPFLAD